MRGFLAGVAAFLGLQALVAAAVAWAWTTQAPPAGYHSGSRVKHRRLEEAPSPRVVFVGGSSVSFGVDAAQVERALGRAAVNMGSYAWLGLAFMLAEVEGGLRTGDVVVLAPELELLTLPASRHFLVRVLRENPRAFRLPAWEDKKWFLDHGHGPLGAEVRQLLSGLAGGEEAPAASGKEFDARGDFAAYDPSRPPMRSVEPYAVPGPDDPRLHERIEAIHAFADRLRARGVRVWFAFPPLEAAQAARQADALAALDRALDRRLRVPRLGSLEDALFPLELFYDSNYHLTADGRRRRTERLVERLRTALSN